MPEFGGGLSRLNVFNKCAGSPLVPSPPASVPPTELFTTPCGKAVVVLRPPMTLFQKRALQRNAGKEEDDKKRKAGASSGGGSGNTLLLDDSDGDGLTAG
jgi:hypothetical protein